MTRLIRPAMFAIALLATQVAGAQERSDVARGREFAGQVCATCHAIRPGQAASPVAAAPTFPAIAASPGMSAIALRVALRTSHETMPNLVLTGEQLDEVVAYITSLQARN